MTEPERHQTFHTTRWSLVASARTPKNSEDRRDALTELYSNYWYPLFAYLRRKGYSATDTSDYLQSFFVELIEKDVLKAVQPETGRFRWFMMSAAARFASKQLVRQNAAKRGGTVTQFSIDIDDAERRYMMEPVDGWTPEKLFDRGWALEVLKQSLEKLREEYQAKSKERLFELLQSTLSGSDLDAKSYEAIAQELDMTEGAIKVAAFRLRARFRDVLKEVVAQTVQTDDEVDNELEQLLSSLRGD